MGLKEIMYLAALVAFALGCRSFENRWLRKLGWVCLLAASYMLAWLLTGAHLAGALAVSLWFLAPWLEIAGRVRRLRFPLRSEIRHRFPPSREVFPHLPDMTAEVEQAGYEEVEDAGWTHHDTEHFVRLLWNGDKRVLASINIALHGEMGFGYASLTSRTESGLSLTTSNFPFPPPMRFAPWQRVNRVTRVESFEDLEHAHLDFLQRQRVAVEDLASPEAEAWRGHMEDDMTRQIQHNLESGVIERAGDGEYRYSWRGCWFLWVQVVKDMLAV
jgi:hypothetical protein